MIEFLTVVEKKEEERISEKKKQLTDVERQMREMEKLWDMLDREIEAPFTDFLPKVMNSSEISKKEELAEEKEHLVFCQAKLQRELKEMEDFLQKVELAKKEAKSLLVYQEEHTLPNKEIKEALQDVLRFLPQDPVRSKQELEKIVERME